MIRSRRFVVMQHRVCARGTHTASPQIQQRLLVMLKTEGDSALSKRLGVSRQALARVAAGLAVRRGTLHLVEAALVPKG